MEKKMEYQMDTGGTWGFEELNLSYYIEETIFMTLLYICISTHYGNLA